eukprot:225480_1
MDYFSSHIEQLTSSNPNEERCTFAMNLRDTQTDTSVAIVDIYNLSSTYDECTTNASACDVNLPFILGPSASGDSLTLNPLIEAFNLLQFSPSATSTFLTPYGSFYRPIPSDDPQAAALIDLCLYFGWDTLGILYMNTKYGDSLQRAITSYGKIAAMNTTTFSFVSGDNVTLTDTVEAMQDSGLFIFILIVDDFDVDLLSYLLRDKHSMTGYPYYYLGVDAWFPDSSWNWHQYLDIYGGMIGSCPWSASGSVDMLYPYPLNISFEMYAHLSESQQGIYTMYAYDVMLTIFKLIDEFIGRNEDVIDSIDSFWDAMANHSISSFRTILSDIWFIGLTGNVSYAGDTGDRVGGLWSFCNVDPVSGDIQQIGFSYLGEVTLDEERIAWPSSYSSGGKPRTVYSVYGGVCSSSSSCAVPIFIYICVILSMLATIVYCAALFYYRQRKIIWSSQWQLSVSMCVGCLSCYVAVLMFGMDQTFAVVDNWDLLCNARLWLLNLSFSCILCPLFT